MRALRLAPLLLLAAAPALADDRVSEARSVSGFTRIELIAPIDVVVRPGKFSCTVNTERSIAAMLRTEVSGDTLRIVLDGRHVNMHSPPKHRHEGNGPGASIWRLTPTSLGVPTMANGHQ